MWVGGGGRGVGSVVSVRLLIPYLFVHVHVRAQLILR